ncbi:MAG: M23 family metallopeptidase [Clostridia bacterium]|nr:M23 family metallopeptidase [Clostridia bacterium]
MTRIFVLSAAGAIAALALAAFFINRGHSRRAAQRLPEEPVLIEESAIPEEERLTVAAVTPGPSPTAALPADAATLLSDGVAVLTLESEQALKAMLLEYLNSLAFAPEGERFLSAEFAGELIIVPAAEDAVLTSREDALALLTNRPETVPVRVVTEKTQRTEADYSVDSANDASLASGSRIITQLGSKACAVSVSRRTYVAGELSGESAPEIIEQHESRALIIRVGTWTSRGDTPGRSEGRKARDEGELAFRHPMRGSISSYFGMRNGNMHNGIDISANPGTTVCAPAEGVVVYCGERGAYGFVVDIDHGNGFLSRLTHIDPDSLAVEYNQRVFAGDDIGTLAAPDSDARAHLHYELWVDSVPCNPLFYIG